MAWVKLKKTTVQKDEPAVSVNMDRFTFNAYLQKLAELNKNKYVSIVFDEEERKIGFEFKKESDSDSDYKITENRRCRASELFNKPWVRKVAQLAGNNTFPAKKDGKLWVITLCPAFEIAVKRENSNKIPANSKGIYRYKQGEDIVYIGKGNIRDRLNEKQRADWKFEIIEYSIIENDEEMFSWESYWIDKYKEINNGDLPIYNLISGHSSDL